jgi:hypothetical protein
VVQIILDTLASLCAMLLLKLYLIFAVLQLSIINLLGLHFYVNEFLASRKAEKSQKCALVQGIYLLRK